MSLCCGFFGYVLFLVTIDNNFRFASDVEITIHHLNGLVASFTDKMQFVLEVLIPLAC